MLCFCYYFVQIATFSLMIVLCIPPLDVFFRAPTRPIKEFQFEGSASQFLSNLLWVKQSWDKGNNCATKKKGRGIRCLWPAEILFYGNSWKGVLISWIFGENHENFLI